jgi:hypothetical protein
MQLHTGADDFRNVIKRGTIVANEAVVTVTV